MQAIRMDDEDATICGVASYPEFDDDEPQFIDKENTCPSGYPFTPKNSGMISIKQRLGKLTSSKKTKRQSSELDIVYALHLNDDHRRAKSSGKPEDWTTLVKNIIRHLGPRHEDVWISRRTQLKKLLESILHSFEDREREFRDHESFIFLCIERAKIIGEISYMDGHDQFETMRLSKIGRSSAKFYFEWAKFEFENDNDEGMDEVLRHGLVAQAVTKEHIQEFRQRISQSIGSSFSSPGDEYLGSEKMDASSSTTQASNPDGFIMDEDNTNIFSSSNISFQDDGNAETIVLSSRRSNSTRIHERDLNSKNESSVSNDFSNNTASEVVDDESSGMQYLETKSFDKHSEYRFYESRSVSSAPDDEENQTSCPSSHSINLESSTRVIDDDSDDSVEISVRTKGEKEGSFSLDNIPTLENFELTENLVEHTPSVYNISESSISAIAANYASTSTTKSETLNIDPSIGDGETIQLRSSTSTIVVNNRRRKHALRKLGAASFSSGAQRISACHPDGDSDDETVQLEEPTKVQHDAVEASKLMPPPPCLAPSKATVHSSRPRSPISQFVDPKSSVNSAGLLLPITPATPLSNKPRVLYSEAIRTPQAIEREPPALAQGTRPLVPIPSIPSTPHALDPNSVIHVNGVPYIKLGNIGRGGSSKVYKVMNESRDILALKRVKLNDLEEDEIEQFVNEIHLLYSLKGESCVVQLVDSEVDRTNNVLYMVMEHGEIDLNRLLMKAREKSLSEESSVGEHSHVPSTAVPENYIRLYWQQMLEAVHCIHEHRIVHGDLKPANFLLVEGSVKIIDFGIAKAIQGDTTNIMRESTIGTLNYMSPESLSDAGASGRKVGRASDIWSLGCILYQMVYGKPPFSHLSLLKRMQKIVDPTFEIEYPERRGVDSSLLSVMQLCLQRDSRKRPTIPELLQHSFLRPSLVNFDEALLSHLAEELAKSIGGDKFMILDKIKNLPQSTLSGAIAANGLSQRLEQTNVNLNPLSSTVSSVEQQTASTGRQDSLASIKQTPQRQNENSDQEPASSSASGVSSNVFTELLAKQKSGLRKIDQEQIAMDRKKRIEDEQRLGNPLLQNILRSRRPQRENETDDDDDF